MRKSAIALVLLTASICLSAERFYLIDNETKESSAAISFANGEQALIGSRTYTLKVSGDKATETEAFMRKVIIPSIEFRQAAIHDVINFLLESSRGGIEEPQLNMMLHEQPPESPPGTKTITLQLSRVSLYDALTIVCEKTDMTFNIDDKGFVRITPKQSQKE